MTDDHTANPTPTTTQHAFQAEVRQLLDIVIHSLYTEREIFLRELISNASDALEKLRHLQLTGQPVFDDGLALEIRITTDDTAGTITIQDFGLGLTRAELVENLGTIAHSGSKAFVQALQASRAAGAQGGGPDLSLIGQFGVGFYSAFMVAREVKVFTRSHQPEGEHLVWTSDGAGTYSIEATEGQRRGAKIVLTLKDDAKDFAREGEVKRLIQRYSAFVSFPIFVNGEQVNKVQAIWTRAKNDIKDEEYTEFYKFQANAFDEPTYRLHFNAEAPLELKSLLFVPGENPERFGFGRSEPGVALYCKRVLIDPKPEGLFPEWLRFLRGVVDSSDLPLHISREQMQDSALVRKLNDVLTKRFLKFLAEEAKDNPEKYRKFHESFRTYLKEGVATDYTHREALAKLLRFESSALAAGELTGLPDYVSRMRAEQKAIFYLQAGSRAAAEAGPYLEAFKTRGLEVLLCFEPMDEFVMSHLSRFDGKDLVAADSADAELGDAPAPEGETLDPAAADALAQWWKETVGEEVEKVRPSQRLAGHPVAALNADAAMTPAMRRLLKQMRPGGADAPGGADRVVLELNPRHALIRKLAALRETDAATAELIARQLTDNARLAAGVIDDPRTLVPRLNELLGKLAGV